MSAPDTCLCVVYELGTSFPTRVSGVFFKKRTKSKGELQDGLMATAQSSQTIELKEVECSITFSDGSNQDLTKRKKRTVRIKIGIGDEKCDLIIERGRSLEIDRRVAFCGANRTSKEKKTFWGSFRLQTILTLIFEDVTVEFTTNDSNTKTVQQYDDCEAACIKWLGQKFKYCLELTDRPTSDRNLQNVNQLLISMTSARMSICEIMTPHKCLKSWPLGEINKVSYDGNILILETNRTENYKFRCNFNKYLKRICQEFKKYHHYYSTIKDVTTPPVYDETVSEYAVNLNEYVNLRSFQNPAYGTYLTTCPSASYTPLAGATQRDTETIETWSSEEEVAWVLRNVINCRAPTKDTLQLPVTVRNTMCFQLYSGKKMEDWELLAEKIGLNFGAITMISNMIRHHPRVPAAEIVLRHWQYIYNRYGQSEQCPRACTKDELLKILKEINRDDILNYIEQRS